MLVAAMLHRDHRDQRVSRDEARTVISPDRVPLRAGCATLAAACGSSPTTTPPRADPPVSSQRLRSGRRHAWEPLNADHGRPRVTAGAALPRHPQIPALAGALPRHPQIPAVSGCSSSGKRCCTTHESQKSTAQRRFCRTSLAGA